MGPARHGPRIGGGVPRRHHRQRRPARDRRGPRRRRSPTSSGCSTPTSSRSARWCSSADRWATASAGVGCSCSGSPGSPAPRRCAGWRRTSRCSSRARAPPGRRCRAARAGEPGDPLGRVPPRRPGQGGGRLVGPRRRRLRRRARSSAAGSSTASRGGCAFFVNVPFAAVVVIAARHVPETRSHDEEHLDLQGAAGCLGRASPSLTFGLIERLDRSGVVGGLVLAGRVPRCSSCASPHPMLPLGDLPQPAVQRRQRHDAGGLRGPVAARSSSSSSSSSRRSATRPSRRARRCCR